MRNNQNTYSLTFLSVAVAGLLFINSGCQMGRSTSYAKEKISDSKFISKLSGKSKKDDIVMKRYHELLGQKEELATKEADKKSPSVKKKNSIQQAGYEAESKTQTPSSGNEVTLANTALMQKNYPEAARLYKEILRKDPTNQMVHHRMAIISDELKDFTMAEYYYMTALLTNPNDPNLLSDLGYSYLLQGKYNKSEEFLKKAIMKNPNHVRALDNLGYLYGKQSRFDLALNYFRKTGSELEAQRKIKRVQSEVASMMPQHQPGMTNPQFANTIPNLRPTQSQNPNQNQYTEIPPASINYNPQPQQVTGKRVQAPNPHSMPIVPPQNISVYNQTPPQTYQNKTVSPVQQIPSTLSPNQSPSQSSINGQVQNSLKQVNVEQFKKGNLIKPGDVNAANPTLPVKKSISPVIQGHSIHNLSPEETWPPADMQAPQVNSTSNNAPNSNNMIQKTTYRNQNSAKMNQAIYTHPHGQKRNQITNIPTQIPDNPVQYQQQNIKPVQQAATVLGLNAGPGGMFPVMNQNGMNQNGINQSTMNQSRSLPPHSGTQPYSLQANQTQAVSPMQQRVQNSSNQNGNWSQNGVNPNSVNNYGVNGFSQNQQTQQVNQNQNANQNQFQVHQSFHGGEVRSGHHLMQKSPIQVFEQKYFDDMNKARSDQKQSLK